MQTTSHLVGVWQLLSVQAEFADSGEIVDVSIVHDQPAVDAESLTGHILRARRHEEPDHIGDVLWPLHTPQGNPAYLPAGELFWRLIEQGPLLASYRGPHVRLDKAGANTVRPDPVGGVGHGEALRHANDRRLAGVVRQIIPAADLAGHRCEADNDAALLGDHRRQHSLRGKEHGLRVNVHDRVPVFLGDVESLRRAIDASVVYKGINPSKLGPRPLDHRLEILAGRHVRRYHQRAPAEAAYLKCSALG